MAWFLAAELTDVLKISESLELRGQEVLCISRWAESYYILWRKMVADSQSTSKVLRVSYLRGIAGWAIRILALGSNNHHLLKELWACHLVLRTVSHTSRCITFVRRPFHENLYFMLKYSRGGSEFRCRWFEVQGSNLYSTASTFRQNPRPWHSRAQPSGEWLSGTQ